MKKLSLLILSGLFVSFFFAMPSLAGDVDPYGRINEVSIAYTRFDASLDYESNYFEQLGGTVRFSVNFDKYVPDLNTGTDKILTADDVKSVRFKNRDTGLILKKTKGWDLSLEPMFIDMNIDYGLEFSFFYDVRADVVGRWKVTVEYNDGTPSFETELYVSNSDLKVYAPKIQNVYLGTNSQYNPDSLVVSFNAGFGAPREIGGQAQYLLRILDLNHVFIKQLKISNEGCGYDLSLNTVFFTIPEEYRGFIGRVEQRHSNAGVTAQNSWPPFTRAAYWFMISE